MKMGSDEKCVQECIKGMGHKYVLYDGKETYALTDQAAAAKFPAKKVDGYRNAGRQVDQGG